MYISESDKKIEIVNNFATFRTLTLHRGDAFVEGAAGLACRVSHNQLRVDAETILPRLPE